MAASEFRIFGPAVGADSPYVTATVDSIDYDGTIWLTDEKNNEISLTSQQLSSLKEGDLIMSAADVEAANAELIKALDGIGDRLTKAEELENYGNFAQQRAEDSLKEMFRAAAETAK